MLDFRSTRTVTYTPAPSGADARRLAEIADIDDLGDQATPQDAARRAELAAAVQPAQQIRFTLQTINALQYGRYEAGRRQVREWIAETFSQPVTEATASDEGARLWSLGLRWARTRAALAKVEQRTISRLDDADDEAWTEIRPAAMLDDPAAYLDQMPAELTAALAAAAEAVNPDLFAVSMEEGAKKNGGVSAE